MKIITVDIRNNRWIKQVQWIVYMPYLLVWIFRDLPPVGTIRQLFILACISLFILIIKFPHEYMHALAGRLMGIKYRVRFGLFVSTCTLTDILQWYQLIVLSLAPFMAFTVGFLIASFTLPGVLRGVLIICYLYSVVGSFGDFYYTYLAVKYRGSDFEDGEDFLRIFIKDRKIR